MKLFCNCNSSWCNGIAISTNRQIQTNLNKLTLCYEGYLGLGSSCLDCGYWNWYDADYENMMFDLKSMNN